MAKSAKKVRVTLWLDEDVVEHYKGRAALPAAAPYQTQINTELRALMEGGAETYAALLNDKKFIAAIAKQVLLLKGRGRGK
jgi:hypothetical protein